MSRPLSLYRGFMVAKVGPPNTVNFNSFCTMPLLAEHMLLVHFQQCPYEREQLCKGLRMAVLERCHFQAVLYACPSFREL